MLPFYPEVLTAYYAFNDAYEWFGQNKEMLEHVVLPLLIVCLITACFYLVIEQLMGRRSAKKYPETRREKPMSRGDREETRLLSTVADIIGDAMEEAEFRGRITRKEKNRFYRQLGHSCGLTDLLPKRVRLIPDLKALKEELKSRIMPEPKSPLPGSKANVKKLKLDVQKMLKSKRKTAA